MWMDNLVGIDSLIEIIYPITLTEKVFSVSSSNHIDVGNAGSYGTDIRNVGLSSLYASYPYVQAQCYFLIIGY